MRRVHPKSTNSDCSLIVAVTKSRMKANRLFPTLAASFLLADLGSQFVASGAETTVIHAGVARDNSKASDAAKRFLATLNETERSKLLFEWNNSVQRLRWSNLPTGIFNRAGLRLGDLSHEKREAALAFLASLLSPRGYQKVLDIMEADEVLKEGGSPGNIVFGKDEFYLSILGTPSATKPWLIQFGGHHLALNITLAGANGVLTPSLTAVQPATYTRNGKTIRPLGRENDKAFALVNSLDATQKESGILKYQVPDLILGPGQDGKSIVPEGIKASQLTPAQQTILIDLIREWVDISPPSVAGVRLEEIKANLPDTYFAWSGPTAPGSAAYFRIQGPTLVIEYSPQKLGGVPQNHIHTIYRDPTNDYGRKFAP